MSDTLPALRATLAELVALDTTSSRPNAPLIDYAQARLEAAGFSAERQHYTDDAGVAKVNLVARKGDADRAALALVGHSDCVPYDAAWTDALRLTERDGKLYGRGACDTKGFIACALHTATRKDLPKLDAPLLVILTADEEVGLVGAKKLVAAGLGRAKHAIVGEPTRLIPVRANKGYCLAEVEVLGKEGHSAYPELGASAIFRAGRFLHRLETLAHTVLREDRDEGFQPPFTTVNVGLIQGGKAKNVLPGSCRFTVEWRPIPGQAAERVPEMMEHIRQELTRDEPAYEARIKVLRMDRGVHTRGDADVVRFLEEVSGNASETVSFGTEAPQLTELGAEAVVFGPGDIRVAHQTGEFVPMEDLVRCESALTQAVARFCTGR
ncbi:acetylornithine deacetylase [Corallococcus carmarthensis]|uniref:Acetylornithine deacetylase n=1 Tax=Corallococcus carmarthensis TaxID=2316728 RepID=A0A3A8KB11_9BACT|nr:acetylornithine deacetylase [Corallococcus carmarthensis]NOK16063.1 acetylornithine deacetylase [Corallococcus carmarthensis]RKH05190.1 acetylornithine deacetylase [Corallococcus carmarthensis]